MHALTRFIRERMDRPPVMTQADLVKASGLSKQVISNLCTDDREKLDRLPSAKTINGIAKALAGGNVGQVLNVIGEAMGLPMNETVEVPDAHGLTNEQLLAEISRRMESGASQVTPLRPVGGPGQDHSDDLDEALAPAAHTDAKTYVRDRARPAPPDEGA